MGEQVLAESPKRVDNRGAGLLAVVVSERLGRSLDGVEVVGDAAMLALEAVDDRVDGRVGVTQLG